MDMECYLKDEKAYPTILEMLLQLVNNKGEKLELLFSPNGSVQCAAFYNLVDEGVVDDDGKKLERFVAVEFTFSADKKTVTLSLSNIETLEDASYNLMFSIEADVNDIYNVKIHKASFKFKIKS
jgi:hypothetical protein